MPLDQWLARWRAGLSALTPPGSAGPAGGGLLSRWGRLDPELIPVWAGTAGDPRRVAARRRRAARRPAPPRRDLDRPHTNGHRG